MLTKLFSLFKKPTLQDISFKYPYDYSEIRKRTRILVIDDHEEHFPIESLKKDGYAIDHWPKINSDDLSRLERGDFDVIILDIKGVADKSISATDGLGILERLKKTNPSQIVIAFSGQSFKLSQNKFWELADGYISKPTTFIECKEKIEEIFKTKITFSYFWGAARKTLSDNKVSESDLLEAEKRLIKSIQKKQKLSLFELLGNAAKITEGSVFAATAIGKIYSLILAIK